MTEQQFDKDTWRTPRYFFDWLLQRFNWFDIDGCADHKNALAYRYIGKPAPEDDDDAEGFNKTCVATDFLGEDLFERLLDEVSETCHFPLRIFVNPPYSNVTPYLKRAKELRDAGHLVVMLLNNDKSTQWYQNHIHNVANEVIDIVGGRINFIHPITGEEIKGNTKGQMVVVFDPAMEDFVQRSVTLDFVKKCGGYGN
ncbi:DNA N-6-adenine-methyltransferase [Avibacterium paragallinarum]|uniref:Phage N-6-adenine-methyltransferase n=1 Tax=Avibacterium paragallinarum TaxID=728 RepID=A0ABU7QL05_AVIPA|nr:DNA N-6-adenine-methyltransferase [Avibacterium paragallinarum]QZP14654.1 phage N-6-adenine-methyltransferase [Avibacterium paragallinarum]WAL56309.1 DNA N-6-adenine-methyltransferase [Avibacterium paragallinarum]WAM58894.1 DNA N-6-adenine-methyltransferase [Avibacterium paragallinarum]